MNPSASLKTLYSDLRDNVTLDGAIELRMSPPLLLMPSNKWFYAKERILVVGQETLGWKKDKLGISSFSDFKKATDSVAVMQSAYVTFCFSECNKRHRNSPFWRAYQKLRASFDTSVDGIESNVLWTNLYRCSNAGKSWYGNTNAHDRQLVEQALDRFLLREIELLAPTGIVFFTGPRYDGYLKASLNGEILASPVDERFTTRELAKVCINRHPAPAFRTYHPNYLQRAKDVKYREVIDLIIDKLKA